MKKFFILSLIATFVSVLSVSAQDNTYSMIIKMANGTTFTIGPNEVDSLWFNDGQVTVTGTSIRDLISNIEAVSVKTDYVNAVLSKALAQNFAECQDLIEMNARHIRSNAEIINPETGEPYTWQQYDWEQGKYVDKPVTVEMIVNKIQENYNELLKSTYALQYDVDNLRRELEELRNK